MLWGVKNILSKMLTNHRCANLAIQDGAQKKLPASNMTLERKQGMDSGAFSIADSEYANEKLISLIARSQFKMAYRKM